MTPLLPSDSFVAQAFEEIIADTQNLLDGALEQKPRDADEVKFWRSQRAAFVNAQGDWLSGMRPTPTEGGYILRSASVPGQTHRAWKVGGIWTCSCKAGDRGIFHRHTALINVLERAAELETLAARASEVVSGGGTDPVQEAQPNPIPHAAEAAAWLTLQTRLAVTAQYVATLRAAQRCDPPFEDNPLGDDQGDELPARRLGLRLVQARRRSAYFASAFYLAA